MSLSAYALSVFAVIVVSAVADVMLPDGKTKKTAKAVFSLLITLTLLSPAISLIKGDTPAFDIQTQYVSVDQDFVDYAVLLVWTAQPSALRLRPLTSVSNLNSTPLAAAFSARAMV